MSLPPGSRLGPYEITGPIGAGGMGEVYRARDTKLNRTVALKVLPESFANDAERLARFRREAQTLAALNHPHIAQIHGLEESGSTSALVMELVDGLDLSQRLRLGPIPIDEALPIARQIAEALEAAHEQGVVHRDLKPANIKVRDDGTVKVLDFGLAKASSRLMEGEGFSPRQIEAANSPTITSPAMTMRGVIMGTAAYMSPEQAKGKALDQRTDIWAFGCVLFEMLTGSKAFDGDDGTEILGAVVKTDPDWTRLPPSVPPHVARLLRRCLQKDVRKRQQHIGDARLELEETAAPPLEAPRAAAGWSWLPWALALISVVVAAAALVGWPAASKTGAPATRVFELLMPEGVELESGVPNSLAVSPDGRSIAVIGMAYGVWHVYLRASDSPQLRVIAGTDGVTLCAFSPDGKYLATVDNQGQLATVSLADGLRTLVFTGADAVLAGVAWLSGDRIAFTRGGALWAVPARGGSPEQITELDPKTEKMHLPIASLDGGGLLVFTGLLGRGNIEVVSLPSRVRTRLLEGVMIAAYSPSGHILFLKEGQLLVASFDAGRSSVTGTPARVNDVDYSAFPASISSEGTLVFPGSELQERALVWVDRMGVERLAEPTPRLYKRARLSPDGSRIAFITQFDGLWLLDTRRRTAERLNGDAAFGFLEFPVWAPDGRRVLAASGDGIYAFDPGRAARPEKFPTSAASDFPTSMSPDGRMLLVSRFSKGSANIFALSADGSPTKPVVETPAFESGGAYSPDGRWIAYVSTESGRPQVYLRSAGGGGERHAVTTTGGTQPMWRGDGRELFYRYEDKLLAVTVTGTAAPVISAPVTLFERRYSYGGTVAISAYDVSADGQQFLLVKDLGGRAYLRVVLNAFEMFNRLAPVRR